MSAETLREFQNNGQPIAAATMQNCKTLREAAPPCIDFAVVMITHRCDTVIEPDTLQLDV